jgi:Ran GTPase-activating protein (RanGAP) involved in mRNA processing and transport
VALDTVRYLKRLSTNGENIMERADVTKKARKPKDWATIGTHNDATIQVVDGNDDDDDDEYMFGFDEGAFDAFD